MPKARRKQIRLSKPIQYKPVVTRTSKIYELAAKYPSFLKVGEDGVLEIYCDNHMLSAFRKCQGYFYEQFLSHPGQMLVGKGRSWSLEFGQYFHRCMEFFYRGQRDNWEGNFVAYTAPEKGLLKVGPEVKQDMISFLQLCSELWKFYDLEYYMAPEFKQYIGKNAHNLGGHDGALRLYTQYYKTHWRQEHFRFVGWELSFGHNKEVPILNWHPEYQMRAYYCGRIDLIIDDTETIGPMDHKTTAFFDGKEREQFKPHDGMQGYCYAVQHILKNKLQELGRTSNTTIINHVSIRPEEDAGNRFKRSFIQYTPLEMDMWLKRQQATFREIYNVLVNGAEITWDTDLCNMWYYSSKCPYKALHDVAPAYREGRIKESFETKEAWSPYNNGN